MPATAIDRNCKIPLAIVFYLPGSFLCEWRSGFRKSRTLVADANNAVCFRAKVAAATIRRFCLARRLAIVKSDGIIAEIALHDVHSLDNELINQILETMDCNSARDLFAFVLID
jgi:hypothetical protein